MFTSDMGGKYSVVLSSAQHWSSAWCLVVFCLNLVVVTSVGLLVCGSDMRGSPAGGSHGWLLVRPPDNSFLTGSFPAQCSLGDTNKEKYKYRDSSMR